VVRRQTCEDGVQGEIDLAEMIEATGVFAPLRDKSEFAKLRVDPQATYDSNGR